jgi:hypothetical protein
VVYTLSSELSLEQTPNLSSGAKAFSQALWMTTTHGNPRRIDFGSHPKPSPTEDVLVYLKKGQFCIFTNDQM